MAAGGVGVNYHTLSDFRVLEGEFLEQVLSSSIASLMHAGLVKVKALALGHAWAFNFTRMFNLGAI